jgi:Uma2 family endonuclease
MSVCGAAGVERFYYPDVQVTCAEEEEDDYCNSRPCLIIEVLSATTERADRTEKRVAYQLLESLQEYVLLSQEMPHVEIYRRGQPWWCEFHGAGERFELRSLGLAIEVDELYR